MWSLEMEKPKKNNQLYPQKTRTYPQKTRKYPQIQKRRILDF